MWDTITIYLHRLKPTNTLQKWMPRSFVVAFALLASTSIIGCSQQHDKRLKNIDFLIDWKAGSEYAGYIVAKEKGFYKDEGIQVTLVEGNGANETAQLIASGRYKIGVSSAAAVILINDKERILKSVAAVFGYSPVTLYSLEEKNIVKPKDLLGKRLGVLYQSSAYIEYKAMMNKLNINQNNINEVGISWGVEPVLNGDVDAAMGYIQNQPNLVRLQGKKVNEILVNDWGIKIYSSVIAANPEFIREDPTTAKGIVKASLKGWEYAKQNPEEAIKIILQAYPVLQEDFVKLSMESTLSLLDTSVTPFGYQGEERWKQTAEMLYQQKLTSKVVDLEQIVDNSFLKN